MKKILVFISMLVVSAVLFAHAAIISVDDLGSEIYIEGGFSNGESAANIELILVKDKAYNGPEDTFEGKEIIYKGKLGADGSFTMPKPATEKYEVIMNAGAGHVARVKGPALKDSEKNEWKTKFEAFNFGDWKDFMSEK